MLVQILKLKCAARPRRILTAGNLSFDVFAVGSISPVKFSLRHQTSNRAATPGMLYLRALRARAIATETQVGSVLGGPVLGGPVLGGHAVTAKTQLKAPPAAASAPAAGFWGPLA